MMKDTIFIFEYVSGGGFNKARIPISLFSEGFGMLRSIIIDFNFLDMEIYTLLDYRISSLATILSVEHLKIIGEKDNFIKIFSDLVKLCKYIFIIAPESDNILYNLTDFMGFEEAYLKLVSKLPAIESPIKRLTFNARLKWTALILLLYFVMSQITVYGVDTAQIQAFGLFELLLG